MNKNCKLLQKRSDVQEYGQLTLDKWVKFKYNRFTLIGATEQVAPKKHFSARTYVYIFR